jgi:phospholipid/cholesterol/gamma-HCH transport system permease protein
MSSFSGIHQIRFDSSGLLEWDSGFLIFLGKLFQWCQAKKISLSREGLPSGARRLLELSTSIPPAKGKSDKMAGKPFLEKVGEDTISFGRSTSEALEFIGEAFLALLKFLSGRACYRRKDLIRILQDCGAQAFPIVSLICLLVGLILAFIGAVQLQMFGAEIFVANLVGIGMVRVLGAVMAGVIMAGRTGAAFAAQLGTMQVNEEIDALRTLGISPMEFLVIPRMVALVLMMPLLCLYADFMGVLGGLIVGVGMLDLNLMEYVNQTRAAVHLDNLWIGLVHSVVFGVLVALSGCLRGMQCGRSSSAVGFATTSAVVTGIVAIVIATAVITLICNVLGF